MTMYSSLLLALVLVAGAAHADELRGHVVGVADGDTITVLDSGQQPHKIRLSGIDAPEKSQPFGAKSKANLSALVFDRQVTLQCGKKDRYRREVCVVYVDGQDANLEQIKAGMAWWYRHYAKEQKPTDRDAYAAAEARAKATELGLWAEPNPTPPWEFRHR